MKEIFHIAPKRSGHSWVASMIHTWFPEVSIVDLEGFDPAEFKAVHGVGTVVLQIRDLLNWYASYKRGEIKYRVGAIPSWEAIADEYYQSMYLKKSRVVHVMYDEFVQSKAYRRSICCKLGGTYSEENLKFVPPSGSGSSFDRFEFQSNGDEMKTLTRYKQVPQELFVELFRNRPFLKDFYLYHCTEKKKIEFIKSLKL